METFEKIEPKQEQETVVSRFEDFRGKDLSEENFPNVSIDVLQTIKFDTETIWPEKEKLPKDFNPEKLLEESKNPGLGIKELHEQGITGQGVVVAIIDQKLDIGHPEYKDSIVDYVEYDGAEKEGISMHGPAVASLLVGKDCGVAPGAKLVYKAVPCGRNFLPYAKSLKNIIQDNKNVPQNEKVRVVSCSIGYRLEKPEPGLDEWVNTLEKAKEAGIFVVDAGGEQIDISFSGGGSPGNKDDFESYLPWLYEDEGNEELNEEHLNERKKEIVVPSDYRTMASSWNKEGQYMYNGKGGISWSVPYLAGLFALILQVNPNIKREEIAEIINASAIVNAKGLRIVNPKGIIDLVKERIKS
jgi:subtilisin family serine protease